MERDPDRNVIELRGPGQAEIESKLGDNSVIPLRHYLLWRIVALCDRLFQPHTVRSRKMIFPNLRCPVARARPQVFLRPPAQLKLLRVLSWWRHDQPTATPEVVNLDAYGARAGRSTDPVVETSS
jgi:hypothetical protein